MEHQLLFDIFGIVASLGLILGYLPQAIQTIRTRNTDMNQDKLDVVKPEMARVNLTF